jgi:GTP-binding protein Era
MVALAGRPNAGKSTLLNALVGEKVAIVSDKPQTTRRAIRGVVQGTDWQLVLIDLPGIQRPRDGLTQRMATGVERELAGCDGALLTVDGSRRLGPGDRFVAGAASAAGVALTIAVNKVDRLDRAATLAALQAASALDGEAEVFPVSARTGEGIDPLIGHLAGQLAPGPFLFGSGQHSDLPEHVALAELVREQVLARTRQEVPHAVEVSVDQITHASGHVTVAAQVWVETESQKRILVGAGGRMVKAVGTAARVELERRLGEPVHLDLRVHVRRHWRSDDALLDRLGL